MTIPWRVNYCVKRWKIPLSTIVASFRNGSNYPLLRADYNFLLQCELYLNAAVLRVQYFTVMENAATPHILGRPSWLLR